MFGISSLTRHIGVAALAAAATFAPLAASAQDVPSYATPAYTVSTDETITGRIRSVDGAFNITVDDDRGFVDNVELHPGTIINPTGLTLSAGMSVTIAGFNAGSSFNANQIDTPYSYTGPLPSPVYLGDGYWYPGFGYGYGPSFFLAVVIGGGGYHSWHYAHQPFYGRPWNGHAYFGATVGVAPGAHYPVALNHSENGPATRNDGQVRNFTGNTAPHAPAAFAGRTFAGESRSASPQYEHPAAAEPHSAYFGQSPERQFSSVSTGRYGGSARGESSGGGRGGEAHGGGSHGGGHGH